MNYHSLENDILLQKIHSTFPQTDFLLYTRSSRHSLTKWSSWFLASKTSKANVLWKHNSKTFKAFVLSWHIEIYSEFVISAWNIIPKFPKTVKNLLKSEESRQEIEDDSQMHFWWIVESCWEAFFDHFGNQQAIKNEPLFWRVTLASLGLPLFPPWRPLTTLVWWFQC